MDFFRMGILTPDLEYTIKDIKKTIPDRLSNIARGISSALFFSNNIRQNVIAETIFVKGDNCIVIQFHGDRLRRVSPDERSVSMFLIKAKKHAEQSERTNGWYNEGISFQKTLFTQYIQNLPEDYVINKNGKIKKYISHTILHIIDGFNVNKINKGHQISKCEINNPAYFFAIINWIIDRNFMDIR